MNRKFNDQEISRRNKLKNLQTNNKNPYKVTHVKRNINAVQFHKLYKNVKNKNENAIVKIAGRVIAIRQTFGVIKDFTGKVQFYLNLKTVKKSVIDLFKNDLDLGDIVFIIGTVFRTHKGELTINVKNLTIISKALKPLPEKWHGLEDEELRSRQRYVDLIVNSDSLDVFMKRSLIISLVRKFMDNDGFFEVETPVLHDILGGANARPFITYHNALKRNFYLRIATEIPLKKLVVGGFEKVYEIGRIFRNEGVDSYHNPEFTTIEAYAAYEKMDYMISLSEKLIKYIAKVLKKPIVNINGVKINLIKKFKKIHMIDFIKNETGVDFWNIKTDKEAIALAKEHKIELLKHEKTWGHVINLFFEKYCESKCIQPTFVYGHPTDISPLSKKDPNNPLLTQRFELFINTKEYANGFSELNDPIDQLERFENQIKEKELGNDEAIEIDYDFIDALEYGLPPTAGIGIGIDRLVMLFTEVTSIRNVILFPHMREKR